MCLSVTYMIVYAVYTCVRLCDEMMVQRPEASPTDNVRCIEHRDDLPPVQGRFGKGDWGGLCRGLDESGGRVEERRHRGETFRRAKKDRQRKRARYQLTTRSLHQG
jgi:hypothetical protein